MSSPFGSGCCNKAAGLNKKSLSTSRHISSGLPRPFEIEKTRCSEQKDAFRDKENYVSLLPWMFISLILFMICPFLKWALLLFLTDDAKIRTICEVRKSCTREGRKDVRLIAVNHLLASCYNDN